MNLHRTGFLSLLRESKGVLLEQSRQNISLRTGFERRRFLRALTIIRTSLTKDVPEIFSGTVEVDETYLGGQ